MYISSPPTYVWDDYMFRSNKAVADGAISYHLDHFVSVRVSKYAYGVHCNVSYNASIEEHRLRSSSMLYRRCRGGYAVVAMVIGHGILGFRDPNGIRPLVIGNRETKKGIEWMLGVGERRARHVGIQDAARCGARRGGVHRRAGRFYAQQCVGDCAHRRASSSISIRETRFDHRQYFGLQGALADGRAVGRENQKNAKGPDQRHRRGHSDSGHPAVPAACRWRSCWASSTARGFIKNRYIGRTFIMPGQEQRSKSVRSKLNAIDLEFRGKTVLLVDDSIVRGTTSAQIIDMAREAGAKKVYFASAAPPVRYPNVYGIDMPDTSELVAAGHTDDEVRDIIGADWLIYQDLGTI